MTIPILTSTTSQFALAIDESAAHVDAGVLAECRHFQVFVERGRDEIAAALTHPEYSVEGREKLAAAAREKLASGLRPLDEAITVRQERISDIETRVLAPVGKRSAADLPDLMIEREIRDRLSGKDSLEILSACLEAAERGDTQFIRAVETSPAAYPLLTPVHRAMVNDVRLRCCPEAATLQALRRELSLYRRLRLAAETDWQQMHPHVTR